jgi:saccharopepsin
MGIKAETHAEQVFKAPYIADGTHLVPVTNFLNAQCAYDPPLMQRQC